MAMNAPMTPAMLLRDVSIPISPAPLQISAKPQGMPPVFSDTLANLFNFSAAPQLPVVTQSPFHMMMATLAPLIVVTLLLVSHTLH
jgi:hypothetical protein